MAKNKDKLLGQVNIPKADLGMYEEIKTVAAAADYNLGDYISKIFNAAMKAEIEGFHKKKSKAGMKLFSDIGESRVK